MGSYILYKFIILNKENTMKNVTIALTRAQKAALKAVKIKVAAYKAAKGSTVEEFNYNETVNTSTKAYQILRSLSDHENQNYELWNEYSKIYNRNIVHLVEDILECTLSGDAKTMVEGLVDDNPYGYNLHHLEDLHVLHLMNHRDEIFSSDNLSSFNVISFLESGYSLDDIRSWPSDVIAPSYPVCSLKYPIEDLIEICAFESITGVWSKEDAEILFDLVQKGFSVEDFNKYAEGLRLGLCSNQLKDLAENNTREGCSIAYLKAVLLRIEEEILMGDSTGTFVKIDEKEFIQNIDNGHRRKNVLKYFNQVFKGSTCAKTLGMVDSLYYSYDLNWELVSKNLDKKVFNKFVAGLELTPEGDLKYFYDSTEAILLCQIFGNQIFGVQEAKRGHSLLNLYNVSSQLLDFKLTQQWQQFFAKNLSLVKYVHLVDKIFGDVVPKSEKQFREIVMTNIVGEGSEDMLWAGVDMAYLEEAAIEAGKYQAKESDNLPEVTIVDGNYSLKKLEAGNRAALFIGLATDCCQHLGSAGKTCAIHSYENENSAVYVLTKDDLPVAQSWVWKDGNNLVIDSVEYKRGLSIERITDTWANLAKSFHDKGFNVYIGCTNYGCTKEVLNAFEDLGMIEAFSADSFCSLKGYKGYMDGFEQFKINF